jgi:hypothetical protein
MSEQKLNRSKVTSLSICAAFVRRITSLQPSTELAGPKASTSGRKSAALGSVRPSDIFPVWEGIPGRLAGGEITDPARIAEQVTPAIAETVRKQVEAGIDCVGDGEFWTARSLAHYTEHFTGVEARPVAPGEPPTTRHSTRERDEFPDFYADMDRAGTLFLVPGEKPMPPVTVRVVARGPVKSKGPEARCRKWQC